MEHSKVSILGHYGFGQNLLNGQTIKTKVLSEALCNHYGKELVLKVDTHGGVRILLRAPFQTFKVLKNSKNVVMLPAHNGLRVYTPLLVFEKCFFKGRKLHYVVIGGWLPEFLQKRKWLSNLLKTFDGIYVETNTMKQALEKQGFSNIYVMPNCKDLQILAEEELVYPNGTPFKLCTFSRVMKEKGIEDAVNAVRAVNEALGQIVYTLDIYGQVDAAQTAWFETLKANFPEYVYYKGCVDSDKSVDILKGYLALLFPTHFFTEGVPGTIIDAYAAGIPVISAKWESYADVIDDRKTGIAYSFLDEADFKRILMHVANEPQVLLGLKRKCLQKAHEYMPSVVIKTLIKNFM